MEEVSDAYLRQHLGVTKDHQAIACTRECHIETPRVIKETDSLMFVGTHAGEDDVILFSALERVDRRHFDFFIELRPKRAVPLHIINEVCPLAFIWCDDTDLGRHNTRLQEVSNNLLTDGGFGPLR